MYNAWYMRELNSNVLRSIKQSLTTTALLFLAIGLVVGAAGFVLLRAATWKSDHVHYHANFALYVNGQRDEFKNFTFYEEVAACNANEADNPKARAHMHDMNPAAIHIHAHAVTWSQFFSNIGYTLGDKVITTESGTYVDGADNNSLVFMINGEKVESIANKLIGDRDVLLINYGKDDDATIKSRYDAVPRDAATYDSAGDPANCSGGHKDSYKDNLKVLLGL